DRDAILAQLTSLGIAAEATPLSPHGIRVQGRPRIDSLPAWRDGAIEIQDEGAQLVALLCDAARAHCIVDYCAGAGGKTLALAALAPEARLIACDSDAKRLGRLAPRLARAGITGVESHVIGVDDPLDEGLAERVLVDVPCSGTGAWRRNPDDRHRLTADALAAYTACQDEILSSAAPLVAPGGRLIYATCSLLPRENEDRVDAFLAAHDDFKRLDVRDVWRQGLAAPPPEEGPDLLLTPHRHGTDGFYVAVLERTAQT
ncbi:MAG: RsmB/NOP family class I SAM-dependent RNA methyltransferase, partial [Alphaproteobacteria bacterium]|nr:RsmB/NOP family class I SAM-dependent RNA methyltransferase [Alphaproteobacteria bacterium]